ncbi:MAG: beta-ketoacyl synthase N-terminal-like domain-containing protein [Acidimicrobiales bacterium]|jgi:3-oxoacyl-[acyl-carrier-protein] synthase II
MESQRVGVSIAGVGAVTGYGWGQKLLREGMLSGESAVKLTPGFSSHFDTDEVWVALIEEGGDPADGRSLYARAVRHAAREAFTDAYDRGWRPGEAFGLINGVVLGDVAAWRGFHRRHGYKTSKKEWLSLMPSTVLSSIMQEFDMHGPNMAVIAMCASGVAGILTAKMWIDAGLATDVMVLATDMSGSPENIRNFSDLGVLIVDSPAFEACRPFQEGSRGFVGGEAIVAYIVSRSVAGSYANVRGGSMTHDGFHAISINPDHKQVFNAFRGALVNSNTDASEIAYINAHGPGTKQCDTCEGEVLDTLFPDAEGIFSVKPLAGHCQGAAGAVELVATLHAFETGVIPATPKVAPGHPRLLDGVTAAVRAPMVKSSLGMGGYNAVMVLEPPAA